MLCSTTSPHLPITSIIVFIAYHMSSMFCFLFFVFFVVLNTLFISNQSNGCKVITPVVTVQIGYNHCVRMIISMHSFGINWECVVIIMCSW